MNKPILYSALWSANPFYELFDRVVAVYDPSDLSELNSCLVIWGGEDICPKIYGQEPGNYCSAVTISERDEAEISLMLGAWERHIPVIGVCRGAQLAVALAGGKLIQHVTGHGGSHAILDIEGNKVITNSLHHQMMYPWNLSKDKYRLLAWASPARSKDYLWEDDDRPVNFPMEAHFNEPFKENLYLLEPEIVLLSETKTLCIQGHPEFCSRDDRFLTYCNSFIKQHCLS